MKTIRRSSFVLRRIALAGLGAASLWTASLAHAAIAPSTPGVLEGLQATVRAPVLRDVLPLGKAPLAEPLLVAPSCGKGGCMNKSQAPTALLRPAEPQALPEPVLVAPCSQCIRGHGDAGVLGSQQASEPKALPAPVLVAPDCGGQNCRRSRDNGTPFGSSSLLAGGDPPTVIDSCRGGGCRS